MQKTTTFSRSVLAGRPTEKENSFINSNTSGFDAKTYNLLKYKKQTSQITHTENNLNDTTSVLNRENSKTSSNNISFINNVPTTRPTHTINYYDNFIKRTKNDHNIQKEDRNYEHHNIQKEERNYEHHNIVQKEERNYSISNLFPSILENLNL